MFTCDLCGASFTLKQHLIQHEKEKHSGVSFACTSCEKTFARKANLDRHFKIHKTPKQELECPKCFKTFDRKFTLDRHVATHADHICEVCGRTFPASKNFAIHKRTCGKSPRKQAPKRPSTSSGGVPAKVARISTPSSPTSSPPNSPPDSLRTWKNRLALGGNINQVELPASEEHLDIYLESLRSRIRREEWEMLDLHRGVRWYINIPVQYIRPEDMAGEGDKKQVAYHTTHTITTMDGSDLEEQISEAISVFVFKCEEFLRLGSGWVYDGVLSGELFIGVFKLLEGSSYIPTPKKLMVKHALVNVQNEDERCFLWSVLAGVHPVELNPQRVHNYQPFLNEIDTTDLEYPVTVPKVRRFADKNKLCINVFGYEEKEILPLYVC